MCCTRLAENTGPKNWPSAHYRTNLPGYIFATKARIDSRKKILKQQYLLHIPSQWWTSAYWRRRPIGGFGAPQQISTGSWLRYCSDVAQRKSTELCTMFGRLLGWYTFSGFLPPNGILSGVKFTLRPSLVFSCFGSVTARHWSRGRQPNFSAWYKEWNYGTFASYHFQQRAPPVFRGRPSRWA